MFCVLSCFFWRHMYLLYPVLITNILNWIELNWIENVKITTGPSPNIHYPVFCWATYWTICWWDSVLFKKSVIPHHNTKNNSLYSVSLIVVTCSHGLEGLRRNEVLRGGHWVRDTALPENLPKLGEDGWSGSTLSWQPLLQLPSIFLDKGQREIATV